MRYASLSAMAFLLASVPAGAEAQADTWWDWTLQTANVRVEVGNTPSRTRVAPVVVYAEPQRAAARRDRDDRYNRDDRYDEGHGREGDHAGAPAFCRSGAGHPVHGRAWCVEKGFGLGSYAPVRWERQRWDNVAFDGRWYGDRRDGFDARVLVGIVGSRVYGRLDVIRGRLGGRYPLTGRWVEPRRGVRVLQVRSGPMAIAEFTDLNGDGRVDAVMVASR